MFDVSYNGLSDEVLVCGTHLDFEAWAIQIRALADSGVSDQQIDLPATSLGKTPVSGIIVRMGPVPNRVSFERGLMVFSIAPVLLEQFLSFIYFPRSEKPSRPDIQPHSHFEYLGQSEYIAPDSLPVVFGIKRHGL